MHARDRWALRTQLGLRIPARIEKNKQGTDVVLRRDREELVETLLKSIGVLLPEQIVQEDAHRVHAQVLGPAQFFVDLLRIEGAGLPHLQFIDGVGGNEIAANQPRLLLVPLSSFLFTPTGTLRQRRQREQKEQSQQQCFLHMCPDYF